MNAGQWAGRRWGHNRIRGLHKHLIVPVGLFNPVTWVHLTDSQEGRADSCS